MDADPAPRGGHAHDQGEGGLSDPALRVRALESLLIEKGYVDPAALDAIVETYEKKIGPRNGARVVARSWIDPDFRQWLFEDATAAMRSLGYAGRQGEHMVALANTPAVHNLIVCTLCSCYPWPVLGLPPVWYKSPPYRSRAVIDPRGVLAEFGVALPPETKIRVWDSTAEFRYLVVRLRPGGTDGWSEERLAALVSRYSMIGTGLARPRFACGGRDVVNGAQDLGGMMGFGPVIAEADEPVFHADWEKRTLALTLAAGALGEWNIDMQRHARESLPGQLSVLELLRDLAEGAGEASRRARARERGGARRGTRAWPAKADPAAARCEGCGKGARRGNAIRPRSA